MQRPRGRPGRSRRRGHPAGAGTSRDHGGVPSDRSGRRPPADGPGAAGGGAGGAHARAARPTSPSTWSTTTRSPARWSARRTASPRWSPRTDRCTATTGAYYRTLSDRASLVALSRAQREQLPTARWAATVPNGVRPDRFPFRAAKGRPCRLPRTRQPGQGPGVGHRGRPRGGHPAGDGGQVPRGRRDGVLRARRGAAARRRRGVDRRGRWPAQGRAPGRRALSAVPHRLAGALRPGDDRGHGLRDPGGRAAPAARCPRWSSHGRTGWVCDRPSELPAALLRAAELDPRDCRAAVEERFSAAVLAAGYERVYRRIAAAGRPPAASRPAS